MMTESLACLDGDARGAIEHALAQHVPRHGKVTTWDGVLAHMPRSRNCEAQLASDIITITTDSRIDADDLATQLRHLMPWRKGPWLLHGINLDAEWRSDRKWQRLLPHIAPLAGREVLDVGCGNGYYLFRMLGEGASLAVGVDPSQLFLYQFWCIKKMMPPTPATLLPLLSEQLPAFGSFDTVMSMGVLSHRRAPMDHLAELVSFLRPGGELVLETLVIDGDESTTLVPQGRYAQMANVWFLPSTRALELWLSRVGLINIRTVDTSLTTTAEQRSTDWMQFQSLSDFLDPDDSSLTVEGHPAPTRAIMIANRPP